MKTITVKNMQHVNLTPIFQTAQSEPVILLTTDGREFILSQADHFAEEVETLRNSQRFQRFLDERMACQTRIALDELEREVDLELQQISRLSSAQ